jgi:hypothetical protein
MYIDIHTHAFHPKIAHKVVAQLEDHYQIKPAGTGLAEDLKARLERAGLDMAVILCAATAPAQVIPANTFARDLQARYPDKFISFGSIHPDCPNWEEHITAMKKAGVRGLKFHPEFQNFWLDDPALLPILEAVGEDLLIMCHIGDQLPPKENPSCPYKLQALRRKFPKARFIAAHMGGYLHWEHALQTYIGEPVYIDTSSALPLMDPALRDEIFRRHPREFILFGSDYPLFDPGEALYDLERGFKLSDEELDDLLLNSARALGLK